MTLFLLQYKFGLHCCIVIVNYSYACSPVTIKLTNATFYTDDYVEYMTEHKSLLERLFTQVGTTATGYNIVHLVDALMYMHSNKFPSHLSFIIVPFSA